MFYIYNSSSREEIENPRVWAQICLQRMAELGKESSTMRRLLEPMLVYFDSGRHWSPQEGLAMKVLCDMAYFVEVPGIFSLTPPPKKISKSYVIQSR